MPVSHLILPAPGVKIGFWKITESSDALLQMYNPNPSELKEMTEMKETRRQHYLSSRMLVKTLHSDAEVYKDEFGKPHLKNQENFISWTHSGSYAACISNANHAVGIDIENINPRILRVEDKFCNAKDKAHIHKTHHSESLTLIWAAKESIYKMYGRKEVDFKLHMTVNPFDLHEEGSFEASLHRLQENIAFHMEYVIFEGYIAVWTAGIL